MKEICTLVIRFETALQNSPSRLPFSLHKDFKAREMIHKPLLHFCQNKLSLLCGDLACKVPLS